MYKFITICFVSIFINTTANATPNNPSDTITIEDKTGVIQEKRIKSIQSQITIIPKALAPYEIIAITDDGTNGVNQHTEAESLNIPTWTIFSW